MSTTYMTRIESLLLAFAVPRDSAVQREANFLERLGVPRWQQAFNLGLPRRTVTICDIVNAGTLLDGSEKRYDPIASLFIGAGGKSYGFALTSDTRYYKIVRRDNADP